MDEGKIDRLVEGLRTTLLVDSLEEDASVEEAFATVFRFWAFYAARTAAGRGGSPPAMFADVNEQCALARNMARMQLHLVLHPEYGTDADVLKAWRERQEPA